LTLVYEDLISAPNTAVHTNERVRLGLIFANMIVGGETAPGASWLHTFCVCHCLERCYSPNQPDFVK